MCRLGWVAKAFEEEKYPALPASPLFISCLYLPPVTNDAKSVTAMPSPSDKGKANEGQSPEQNTKAAGSQAGGPKRSLRKKLSGRALGRKRKGAEEIPPMPSQTQSTAPQDKQSATSGKVASDSGGSETLTRTKSESAFDDWDDTIWDKVKFTFSAMSRRS
ncbi:hypothetical protein QFC20_006778 [Naganishia adeliensis]|uniref:Uncharacterized protein n=1 Tax=Naganishia adeliensis TaxID=92952 RepID=A0ACC2V7F1_9TREE|nr:hypothetical protein QFC20_006778 [Naganishia adeliensis]